MVKLKLSTNSLIWQCPDYSGIVIYNGYDGNTVFLRSNLDDLEQSDQRSQSRSHTSSSLITEFTHATISLYLGVNEMESEKILSKLINWGILIGSDD